MYTIFHTIYNILINDYYNYITIYSIYNIRFNHISCIPFLQGGKPPEASVVEVLSISPRSEESPPGFRSAFSCLHQRNQAPFWDRNSSDLFLGGGWCGCAWGEIHDLFFHGSRAMFHLCRKFMQSKIEHLFERTFETKLDPVVLKVILTCKVVTYSKRLQRFGKKLFLQFCMKNCTYS